jgi:CRP/FNR family transcriptional regulator
MDTNIVDFPPVTQSCREYDWSDCFVSHGLDRDKTTESQSNKTIPYRKYEHFFRQGDTVDSVCFLRSGSAKSIVSTIGGAERIVGFHFPGDLLGLDGVMSARHQSTTVALETTGVCRIPLTRLKVESVNNADIWNEVLRLICDEIANKQDYALLLAQKSVRARFATFLCYLSSKFASRGYSTAEFNLSMSRRDIANYLTMAGETLSRLVGEFQQRGLIEVKGRFVRIIDVRSLNEISYDDSLYAVSFG